MALLFITVGLKQLLTIFSPLKEWEAETGVNSGQTSEVCSISSLHLQSLWW